MSGVGYDLLKENQKVKETELVINNEQGIKAFPYEQEFNADKNITFSKSGTGPVFISVFQDFWNNDPDEVATDFVINTHFEEDKKIFKAGKVTILNVNLEVKKDAEYIMIEVPIPAGFSYSDKTQGRNEDHREYHKNKVNIYFSKLSSGDYDFQIKLLPRFNGSFHLNPAKAEMMYFPVFFGRNETKWVKVN